MKPSGILLLLAIPLGLLVLIKTTEERPLRDASSTAPSQVPADTSGVASEPDPRCGGLKDCDVPFESATQAPSTSTVAEPTRDPHPAKVPKGSIAYLDAHYSFRDVKFGTPRTAFRRLTPDEDVADAAGDPLQKWYTRGGDNLKAGAGRLQSIAYGFFHDQLGGVSMRAHGATNSRALLAFVEALYGKGKEDPNTKGLYTWQGERVGASFQEFPDSHDSWFVIGSLEIEDQWEKELAAQQQRQDEQAEAENRARQQEAEAAKREADVRIKEIAASRIIFRLDDGSGLPVRVFVDEEALDAAIRAFVNYDSSVLPGLIAAGRVFTVEPGRRALPLYDRDRNGGLFSIREQEHVRILEGEAAGQSGWVPTEWLKPWAPK